MGVGNAKNTVKETLAGGGISVGTMVFEFNSTGIGRIAARQAPT